MIQKMITVQRIVILSIIFLMAGWVCISKQLSDAIQFFSFSIFFYILLEAILFCYSSHEQWIKDRRDDELRMQRERRDDELRAHRENREDQLRAYEMVVTYRPQQYIENNDARIREVLVEIRDNLIRSQTQSDRPTRAVITLTIFICILTLIQGYVALYTSSLGLFEKFALGVFAAIISVIFLLFLIRYPEQLIY